MHKEHTIITIDGPSGAGKSTIARTLAKKLNYTYLDTGAMYRAVGLKIERTGVELHDEKALARLLADIDLRFISGPQEIRVFLDDVDVSNDIRTAEMGLVASRVSAIPQVRGKLTELQRGLGRDENLVADGRDMGTVVFPKADYKFYLDATPRERARRRYEELRQKGQEVSYPDILQQIIQRDHNDSMRTLAPLKPASDAVIIDSTKLAVGEVVSVIMKRLSGG